MQVMIYFLPICGASAIQLISTVLWWLQSWVSSGLRPNLYTHVLPPRANLPRPPMVGSTGSPTVEVWSQPYRSPWSDKLTNQSKRPVEPQWPQSKSVRENVRFALYLALQTLPRHILCNSVVNNAKKACFRRQICGLNPNINRQHRG